MRTAASLLQSLSVAGILNRGEAHVFISFDATVAGEAERIAPISSLGFATIPRSSSKGTFGLRQQIVDHSDVIEYCIHRTKAPHILILEDDCYILPSLFAALAAIVRSAPAVASSGDSGNILLLKLFVPVEFSDSDDLLLIVVSIICTFILLAAILWVVLRLCGRSPRMGYKYRRLYTIGGAACLTVCLVFWMFRINERAIRHLVTNFIPKISLSQEDVMGFVPVTTKVRGSAVANLYFREHVPVLVSYLRQQAAEPRDSHIIPVDISIDRFRREHELAQLRLEPNGVEHFGCFTSSREKLQARLDSGELVRYCSVTGPGTGAHVCAAYYSTMFCWVGQ